MNLRFVSWNIHNRQHITAMLDLLHAVDGDIIALQEVSAMAYQKLAESSLFSWAAFSLDIRLPRASERPGRRLGCAVLGKAPSRLQRSMLLESAPLPERALIVDVEGLEKPLTICSFHAPPGVSWGDKKPQSHLALAHWLGEHQWPILVGMDANAPKTDHSDYKKNEWWWKEEALLLGPRPLHPLRDAFRLWLSTHPREAEHIRSNRPKGPLAVSYNRGRGMSIPCRYDCIYLTPDIDVVQVRYLYDEALKAGSDHALVVADLVVSLND